MREEVSTAAEAAGTLNLCDWFLDARVREGRGARIAIRGDDRSLTYDDVAALAARWGETLIAAGVDPEQRVLLALPDGPAFAGAFFGALRAGAVVVMANPGLKPDEIDWMLDYTRAKVVVAGAEHAAAFAAAARDSRCTRAVLVAGSPEVERALAGARAEAPCFPSHPDDPAIWLFSGGTTGRPKAVIQTHRSFVNTTECYAKQVIGYREDDVTISVPKLYFGYATGSNLLFPFAAGASTHLFPEPVTADVLFERIRRHRPTILINVPTMIHKMLEHPDAKRQDLSSIRVCTSAGEALPAELDRRWRDTFGVELLDGLGTAEMWHIFVSNRPGHAKPGTLGTVVPGFAIKACDDEGRELPRGETGWLWVRGNSRAIAYWQHMAKTCAGFRGEWYVTGDLVQIDDAGFVTYHGRGDEMLKVAGKWLAPQEVEGCLLEHPAVAEVAVVGQADANGLVKPIAFVAARETRPGLAAELQAFVRERLDAYKHPREVVFVDALPRTHLGKVDRGRLRRG